MSRENRPAFLFYASDWLSGTSDMTLEEQGIYLKLLCHQWLNGGIPTDQDRILRLVFGPESASDSLANRKRIDFVLQKFRLQSIDGREVFANDRLERIRAAERSKFQNRSSANSENAKRPRKKRNSSQDVPDDSLTNGKRFANDSLTKTQRKEDENECENEDENEQEERVQREGNGRFAHRFTPEQFRAALADFRQVYSDSDGEAKTGNAYREAVEVLMGQGWEFNQAAKMLRDKAAEYRAFLQATTRQKMDAKNWLGSRAWENDYHAKLKEERNRRIENGNHKNNGRASNAIGNALSEIAASSDL